VQAFILFFFIYLTRRPTITIVQKEFCASSKISRSMKDPASMVRKGPRSRIFVPIQERILVGIFGVDVIDRTENTMMIRKCPKGALKIYNFVSFKGCVIRYASPCSMSISRG
jgi:hypothetical protein